MQFAVIAEISAIRRKEFTIQLLSVLDDEPVPVNESPYIFLAEGTCLDIFFVGKFGELYGR